MRQFDKRLPRVLWVAAFIILIAAAGLVFLPGIVEKSLRKKLENNLLLTFDDLDLSFQSKTLVLLNVRFRDSIHNASILVPEMRLEGFHFFRQLFRGQTMLERAVLLRPEIKIRKDSVEAKSGGESLKKRQVFIGQLKILNGEMLVQETLPSVSDTIFRTGFDFEMHQVTLDNHSRLFHFGQLAFDSASFSLKNGKYIFPDKLYRLNYQTGEYRTTKQKLDIDVLSLTSEYSKYEMGRQTGTETDWLDLLFTKVELSGVDLQKLLSDTALVASHLQFGKMKVEAFKDKRLPFPQKPNTKLPMDLINSLPFGLHFDSVICKSGDIQYSERVAGSNDAGVVTFSDFKFKISQLSNRMHEITDTTTIEASALAMQQVLLNASFEIPNVKYNVEYRAKGTLAPALISAFNPVIRHNAGVVVQRGAIKSFAFDFRYDNDQSQGQLLWQYDSLKVLVFDRASYRSKRFQSFLVNKLVLKSSNLKGERNYKTGNIGFTRDKKKSVFNYWWKSLLSGLKDIAII